MAVTPQTNTTLEEVAAELLKHESFCICGHVSPDGDCIGSQLALKCALEQLGRRVDVLLAKREPIPVELDFLPGAGDFVWAKKHTGPVDAFVSVDVPNDARMVDAAEVKARAAWTVTLDHHAASERASLLSYTDPDAASTTTIVWELARLLGVDRTGDVATCCFAGLVTDTGRFMHQNTDVRAMRAACEMMRAGADASDICSRLFNRRTLASVRLEAAVVEHLDMFCGGDAALSWISKADMAELGAVKRDCEPMVELVRSIDGVRVACMLREEGDSVRGSLRAKDDTDVARIAASFGGGGHKAAAGFTMHTTLEEAKRAVKAAVEGVLFGSAAS